jgi:hypothetical protein
MGGCLHNEGEEMRNETHVKPSSQVQNQTNRDTPFTDSGAETNHKDNFVSLMWFGPSEDRLYSNGAKQNVAKDSHYHLLAQSRLNPKAGYHLPARRERKPVDTESPAIEVMTDLNLVRPVTINSYSLIEEANQAMMKHRVRALFVVDEKRRVLGFITSTDTLGEKPMLITQQRGIKHDEVMVRDIMITVDRLEVIDLNEILFAKVGDVVATLKHASRQHALVVERTGDGNTDQQLVRGIMSMTQILQQLGLKPQIVDNGHTFAELESAIGH